MSLGASAAAEPETDGGQLAAVSFTCSSPTTTSPHNSLPIMRRATSLLAGLSLAACAQAFYLPGAAPHNYVEGDRVELFVNALTPMLSGSDDIKLVRCKLYPPCFC